MERELLLELGLEEIPASWLPALTIQIGEVVAAQLRERRLGPETPVETYSTPRRLTVRIERIPERQADFEELINGPAASAPAQAIAGFATKQGIDPSVLEKVETPKGVYLAYRKKVRGRTAVDVLPEVLGGTLRALAFPKMMHWDAMLDDGKGELLFGRPIRWMLYTYGGRVVPFAISRTPGAQTSQVQDVTTGAATYGHRFLTTSGRAGRSIKVRSFDEYRARLLENFVILERNERHDRIASQLDAKAQRRQGRVSKVVQGSGLLHEVPDLVEYPAVVSGEFAKEFLELPEEVLTTTLIHHQHYFPIEGEDGKLKNAFLAVINIEPDNEQTIARNAERVVTARLRDARFFWEADRKSTLESKVERLSTLVFHKKLGSYKDKSERIAKLAEWIAREAFQADDKIAGYAARAAFLAKADLTTDMVREFPELQGIMGGVYARVDGEPEEVWKAIYYHYLPQGVEADAPPTKAQLGKAAITWAAVSLADKLDTIAGLFSENEIPTGSRDPFALRRATQGVLKILVDLPGLCSVHRRISVGELVNAALDTRGRARPKSGVEEWSLRLCFFFAERLQHVLRTRGAEFDEVNAVSAGRFDANLDAMTPASLLAKVVALKQVRGSQEFLALAELFKRVKNISKGVEFTAGWPALVQYAGESTESAEKDLVLQADGNRDRIQSAEARGEYVEALKQIGTFKPFVAKYFDDVMVMADDPIVREKRLQLMVGLRDLVLQIADISEIVSVTSG